MESRLGLSRTPIRLLRSDFLLEVSVLALERWDRLDSPQQARYRELAAKADGRPSANLEQSERQELHLLWKRLGVRKLISEVAKKAARRPIGRSADTL
jgi:hypothetical protein